MMKRRTHKALSGDLGVIAREMHRHRKTHKNLKKPFKPYPRRHAIPATPDDAIVLENWNADKARYIVQACKINDDYLHNSGTGLHLDANQLYKRLQSQRTDNPKLKFVNAPQIPAHCLKHIARRVVEHYIALWQQPTREHKRYTTPPDPAPIPLYFDRAHYDGTRIVLAFAVKLEAPEEGEGVLHYNAVKFRSIQLFWNAIEKHWEMIVTYRRFPTDHTP